ncbi:hypothetical protein ACF0H5_005168 [Mactra antiquata]
MMKYYVAIICVLCCVPLVNGRICLPEDTNPDNVRIIPESPHYISTIEIKNSYEPEYCHSPIKGDILNNNGKAYFRCKGQVFDSEKVEEIVRKGGSHRRGCILDCCLLSFMWDIERKCSHNHMPQCYRNVKNPIPTCHKPHSNKPYICKCYMDPLKVVGEDLLPECPSHGNESKCVHHITDSEELTHSCICDPVKMIK